MRDGPGPVRVRVVLHTCSTLTPCSAAVPCRAVYQVKKGGGLGKRPLGDIKHQAVNGSSAAAASQSDRVPGSAQRTRVSNSILNLSGNGAQDDAAPECNQQ